jgi:hypothetical protein
MPHARVINGNSQALTELIRRRVSGRVPLGSGKDRNYEFGTAINPC